MKLQGHIKSLVNGGGGKIVASLALPAEVPNDDLKIVLSREAGVDWIPGQAVFIEIESQEIRARPQAAEPMHPDARRWQWFVDQSKEVREKTCAAAPSPEAFERLVDEMMRR